MDRVEKKARDEHVKLYRACGEKEWAAILELKQHSFPTEPAQSWVFHTRLEDAQALARDQKTTESESNFMGYVVEFTLRKTFLTRFGESEKTTVYRIPSGEMEDFNQNISRTIRLVKEYGMC